MPTNLSATGTFEGCSLHDGIRGLSIKCPRESLLSICKKYTTTLASTADYFSMSSDEIAKLISPKSRVKSKAGCWLAYDVTQYTQKGPTIVQSTFLGLLF